MDNRIKRAIDDKYNSIVDSYEIMDGSILSRLGDWYQRMNALGEEAKDVSDFETKFANSELVREYSDIYMEITQKCRLKEPDFGSSADEWIEDEKNNFMGGIPIIGSIFRAKRKIDYLKNLRSNNEDE